MPKFKSFQNAYLIDDHYVLSPYLKKCLRDKQKNAPNPVNQMPNDSAHRPDAKYANIIARQNARIQYI